MSTTPLVREPLQERVLTSLGQAPGRELTYDELREVGIEFPATVISELQLLGVPVERRYRGGQPAFRLDPGWDRAPTAPATTQELAPAPVAEAETTQEFVPLLAPAPPPTQRFVPGAATTAAPESRKRVLGGAALVAAVAAVLVLALTSLNGGGSAPTHRARIAAAKPSRPAKTQHFSHLVKRGPSQRAASAAQPASASPVSAPATAQASAGQLEAQGHGMLVQGRYAAAVPVLQHAVQATGETASACAQPVSQNCLTLAFALYDLGRALRLSGNPAAAVPVLQQRLLINNQTSAVAAELRLAQGSGSGTSSSSAAALEAQGHSLLQSGQYSSAIPVLQQAVQATGESASACAQPTTSNCQTYAFALYDLGVALRLSGNPSAAVPILEQRLRINNQQSVVAAQLRLAQSAA